MATRGRKPLPTALKELEGDRGKGRRPLNKDEPTPPQNNVKSVMCSLPSGRKDCRCNRGGSHHPTPWRPAAVLGSEQLAAAV